VDASVGMGATDERGMHYFGRLDVIDEACTSQQQIPVLDAAYGFPDRSLAIRILAT
jgi:hypothetical protein